MSSDSDSLLRKEGLMGFFLPRVINDKVVKNKIDKFVHDENVNNINNNNPENNIMINECNIEEDTEKSDKILLTPTAFYFNSNDGLNLYLIQSYECISKDSEIVSENAICADCKIMWRKIRNKTPSKVIKVTEHNKIIKSNNKKYETVQDKLNKILAKEKVESAEHNKTVNKLLKRVSY